MKTNTRPKTTNKTLEIQNKQTKPMISGEEKRGEGAEGNWKTNKIGKPQENQLNFERTWFPFPSPPPLLLK